MHHQLRLVLLPVHESRASAEPSDKICFPGSQKQFARSVVGLKDACQAEVRRQAVTRSCVGIKDSGQAEVCCHSVQAEKLLQEANKAEEKMKRNHHKASITMMKNIADMTRPLLIYKPLFEGCLLIWWWGFNACVVSNGGDGVWQFTSNCCATKILPSSSEFGPWSCLVWPFRH